MSLILASLGAYLLGSVPFAVWITRIKTGVDLRSMGSGHAGATNAMRAGGWFVGISVMLVDVGKGFLAAWLAAQAIDHPLAPVLAAAAVEAGHCWPALAGFRGGMGVAASGGAFLAVWPLGFVLGTGWAALLNLILRHTARANVVAGLTIAVVWWVFGASAWTVAVAAAAGWLVALRALADWDRVYSELWLDRR